MRTIFIILFCALAASAQWLSVVGGAAVCSLLSTGTMLNEGFHCGNYAAPDGTSGLQVLWLRGANTADSIVDCPAGQSGKCLHINKADTTAAYIYTNGFTPTMAAGTTWTATFNVNVHSANLANSNSQLIFAPATSVSNSSCSVVLYNTGSTSAPTINGKRYLIRAFGSTNSSSSATNYISADTWYTVSLRCSTTSNDSAISLDGNLACAGTGSDTAGHCYRFTAASKVNTTWMLGTNVNTDAAADYYENAISISSTAGNVSGDSGLTDYECGTGGTCSGNPAMSTTILNGSTHAGNGTWTTPVTTGATIGASNLGSASDTVAGSSVPLAGSFALSFDHNNTANQQSIYTYTTTSPNVGYCMHFSTNVQSNNSDKRGFTYVQNSDASDFAGANLSRDAGGVKRLTLETHSNSASLPGTGYAYSDNTEYVVCVDYRRSATHTMRVWDATCSTLLSTQTSAAETTATFPTTLVVNLSNNPGARTGTTRVDNVYWNLKGDTMSCH